MHRFTDLLFPSFPAQSWMGLVLGHVLQELGAPLVTEPRLQGLHTSAMLLRNAEGETEPKKAAMDTKFLLCIGGMGHLKLVHGGMVASWEGVSLPG